MKKGLFILLTLFFGITSCTENSFTSKSISNISLITRAPIVGGGIDPNWCEGCGTSSLPADECYGGVCMEVPIDPFDPPICPTVEANNLSYEMNYDIKLDTEIAYDHRDNFMIKSQKGQQYISHYSEIGHFMQNEDIMTVSNVLEFLTFAQTVYVKVDVLRNGDGAEVIVTPEFKNEAQIFIDLINTYDPPSYLTNRLNQITEDLIFFENMTCAEVLSQI